MDSTKDTHPGGKRSHDDYYYMISGGRRGVEDSHTLQGGEGVFPITTNPVCPIMRPNCGEGVMGNGEVGKDGEGERERHRPLLPLNRPPAPLPAQPPFSLPHTLQRASSLPHFKSTYLALYSYAPLPWAPPCSNTPHQLSQGDRYSRLPPTALVFAR